MGHSSHSFIDDKLQEKALETFANVQFRLFPLSSVYSQFCHRIYSHNSPKLVIKLKHFTPMFHFYIPWKRQKTFVFLVF